MARTEHHDDDEHGLPAETTPQGTQYHAVDHGHEEGDIDFRSMAKWAALLLGTCFGVQVLLYGVFVFLAGREGEANTLTSLQRPASQPLGMGGPQLLPNPPTSRSEPGREPLQPSEPLVGPLEYGRNEQNQENKQLEQYKLWNPETGLPQLPPGSLEGIVTSPGTTQPSRGIAIYPEPLRHALPTDSSGGTTEENRHR